MNFENCEDLELFKNQFDIRSLCLFRDRIISRFCLEKQSVSFILQHFIIMEEQSQNGGLENHSEDESGSVQDPLNMDRSHKTNPTLHHSTKRFAVETKPCLSNVNSFDATPSKSSQHPATGIGHSISNTHWPATETRHPSHISDPHEGTNPLGNPHTTINTSESLIFLHSPSHSPQHTFSQDFPTERAPGEIISTAPRIAIIVPRVERRWEYRVYNEEIVVGQVLRELQVSGRSRYLVRFTTGQKLKVCHEINIPLNSSLRIVAVAFISPFQPCVHVRENGS